LILDLHFFSFRISPLIDETVIQLMLLVVKTVVQVIKIFFVYLWCKLWLSCLFFILSPVDCLENIIYNGLRSISWLVSQNFTRFLVKSNIKIFLDLIKKESFLNGQLFREQYFLWFANHLDWSTLLNKILTSPCHAQDCF